MGSYLNATNETTTSALNSTATHTAPADPTPTYVIGTLLCAMGLAVLCSIHKIGPRKKASVLFFYRMTSSVFVHGAIYVIIAVGMTLRSTNFKACRILAMFRGATIAVYLNHMLLMYVELYLSVRWMNRAAIGTRLALALSLGSDVFFAVFYIFLWYAFGENKELVFRDFRDCTLAVTAPTARILAYVFFVVRLVAMIVMQLLSFRLIKAKTAGSEAANTPWMNERRNALNVLLATLVVFLVGWLSSVLVMSLPMVCAPCRGPIVGKILNSLVHVLYNAPLVTNLIIYFVRNPKMRRFFNRVVAAVRQTSTQVSEV